MTAREFRPGDFVIVSYRMDSRGFRDTMFYTGRVEYGVPVLSHDSGNAMRFTEDEAEDALRNENFPYEVGTLPVMESKI